MGIGALISLVAGSGGDDAPPPPPPPPPPDNGIAEQMEKDREFKQQQAEEARQQAEADRLQREKEAAQNKARMEATMFTNLAVHSYEKAAMGAIDHLMKWNETVNERSENAAAVAAGLPPPNSNVDQQWDSYTQSEAELEEHRKDNFDAFGDLVDKL